MPAETDGQQMPDKAAQEKERELLVRFKQVLQAFTHDHQHLQVTATYALQVRTRGTGVSTTGVCKLTCLFDTIQSVFELRC